MNYKKTLLPTLTATSLMTLFSYIIAKLEDENFSEPHLLADIEQKALPQTAKKIALPAGWFTHLGVGLIMTMLFNAMQQKTQTKSALKGTIVFGGLSGIAAIIAWKILLKALPRRSNKFYKQFYTQLFIAHVIFAFIVIQTKRQLV